MGRRGPLSAAHKAAISAGLKRHYASKGGGSAKARPAARQTPSSNAGAAKARGTFPIQNISTGKAISKEEAAIRMFGAAGAAKRLAKGTKRAGSSKRR